MSELRTNRIVPRDGLTSGTYNAGGIIQIRQSLKTDTFSESVSTLTDSAIPFTATITPTRSDSKILIQMILNVGASNDGDLSIKLTRGGSVITAATGDAASNRAQVTATAALFNSNRQGQIITNFLDSPASTSTQTYGFKFRHAENGSMSCYLNRNDNDGDSGLIQRPISSITLYEVSG